MDGKSLDITADILAQLKAILPDVFSEDKIDFQRLKQALGEDVFVKGEHYELNWAGKTEARKEIQKQTTATLVPNRAESVDFDNANHIFIEGENLEVLRTLQKSYFGKVKTIYIDPPYNTGSDSFVYPDDYTERQDEYKKRTGLTNGEGYLNKQDLWRKNVKENGQFHSVWMSMMYPRLYLSRNLLKENGVIFISIDDNEQANLKMLLDEIYGEENFIGTFPYKKRTAKSDVPFGVSQDYEWILCYTKGGFGAGLQFKRRYFETDDFPNNGWRLSDLTTQRTPLERPNSNFTMIDPKTGKEYPVNPQRVWGVTKDTFKDYYKRGKIVFPDDYNFLNITGPAFRVFESEDKEKSVLKFGTTDTMKTVSTVLPKEVGMSETGNKEVVELFGQKIFSFPKSTELIKYLISISNDKGNALILDFFAGSGTTAQAVMELNEEDGGNRRFICVQMPEKIEEGNEAYNAGYKTIADITQARIKKVIEKLQTERKIKAEKEKGELFNGENDTPQYPLGFQSYKLTTSNFKHWNKYVTGEQALLEQLDVFQQAEKENSLPENMLYELLIKGGFDLTTTVAKLKISETANAYNVDNGILWVFFDKYSPSVKAAILAAKPERLIVLDSCFDGDDVAITNLQLDLRENGIDLTII